MKNILLLDNRSDRRERLKHTIRHSGDYSVDARGAIARDAFESGGYDVAIVHYSNAEGPYIEDGWKAEGIKVILFSGGFSQAVAESDGTIYARASFIEKEENLEKLLTRILKK